MIKRLTVFVKPYRAIFGTIVFFTFLTAILGPAKPYLVGQIINVSIKNKDSENLFYMVILLLVTLVSHAIIQYLHTYLSGLLGQNVIRDVRIQLFKHLL